MDKRLPDKIDVCPPKWADRFLEWYCADALLDEIQGDLHEAYRWRVEKHGLRTARRLFIKEVLQFFRPSSFRPDLFTFNTTHMFTRLNNYLKLALRNFTRHALYTFINGFGLVLGLSCSLLILLWVHFEQGVDRFHPEGDRIFRAYWNGISEQGEFTFTQGASPYALYHLFQEYEGVENTAYFDDGLERVLSKGDELYMEKGAWGSPSLFEMFDFPLLAGSASNARQQLESIFISEDVARKLFGEDGWQKSVGSVIKVNATDEQTVAGVFQNLGSNSSLQFDFILNIEQAAEKNPDWAAHWGAKGANVYAKLAPEVDPRSVERYVNPMYKETNGYGVGGDALMLFPFEDNYLWTKFEQGIASGGRIQYTRIFFGAAIFLILIACINFVNLSTALSVKRSKEVGIRKAVGAQGGNILFQFLSETGLLVGLSLLTALLFSWLLLPFMNELTGQTINIPWRQPGLWLTLLGIAAGLTILAGLYPAFVLSLYQPARVLKSGMGQKKAKMSLRKSLVVFQFALSAILVISTITVNQQIHLIQYENLGLDRSNVLTVGLGRQARPQFELIREKLLQNPGIESVIRMSSSPVDIDMINVGYDWEGKTENQSNYFYILNTDADFAGMFGIEMKEGRFFDKDIQSDSSGVLINETGLAQLGLKDPVGKMITSTDDGVRHRILGIMKDFNFKSIHQAIEPLMLYLSPDGANYIMIKSRPGSTQAVVAQLQKTWSEVFPAYPLQYQFLDEDYSKMYKSEMIIGKLAYLFAGIALIISCLGLFGLITFISLQKTREIGIRKVLGASVASIVSLLSREFVVLVVLGLFIAAPIAWYVMDQWLQDFAFRVQIVWWVYGLAAGIALLVTLLTVSYQSVRAALVSPVQSLKSE